jgi:hypothetical protein
MTDLETLIAAATDALSSLKAAEHSARRLGTLHTFHYQSGADVTIRNLEAALEPFRPKVP